MPTLWQTLSRSHNLPMLLPGIYPAAITPFDGKGSVDFVSVARLLAWFESAGCKGAVLAGTNGEGPSLSAVEKRDLLRGAMKLRGKLELVLGIATPSLDEAVWLCKQAANEEASAALVMAPFYFRDAPEEGIVAWFESLLDRSPVPVLVYNFPQRTGVTLTPAVMARLAQHERFLGVKDSSGAEVNLAGYKQAVNGKLLFVGNETLLIKALENGWTGSISGAANTCPHWLAQIVSLWTAGDKEQAGVKFEIILPLLEAIRKAPQPACHKALLAKSGVLSRADPRLPLLPPSREAVDDLSLAFEQRIGFHF